MKKSIGSVILVFVFLAVLLYACACSSISMSGPTATPVDPSALHITYICNDGFIIATGGKKVLIDALFYDSQNICHSDSDEAAKSALPQFDNADLVLISHSHWDHFNPQTVGSYLQNNPKAILIAEKSVVESLSQKFIDYDLVQERVHSVKLARGKKTQFSLSGISVEAISSPADVPNLGYIFQLGEFTFFHSGDSGLDLQTISDFQACQLPGKGINFAFVPYWYLTDPLGRSILEEGIRAESYIPMHYAGENLENIFADVTSYMTTYYPQAIVFTKELQTWSYSAK